MNDGFGALQSALGSFDGLARNLAAFLVRPEFHQASGDDLGQVALLVALGDLDGFVDLAIAQGPGNGGSERTRLFTRGAEGHRAINHDAD